MTPDGLFKPLNAEFKFQIDVAALPSNAKCRRYFTPDDNALVQDWRGLRCWCNPPYGVLMGAWIDKAIIEAKQGALVVMLLPVRSELPWWKLVIEHAAEIRFIEGRVRFGFGEGVKSRGTPLFGSCIVVFDRRRRRGGPRVTTITYRVLKVRRRLGEMTAILRAIAEVVRRSGDVYLGLNEPHHLVASTRRCY